jgi:tetratricopeptide (TPR) repeat protein
LLYCPPPAWAAPEAVAVNDSEVSVEYDNTLTSYRNRIDELIRTRGSLAFELAEEWTALGFAQQAAHNHQAAVGSFENALYIERVHKGLHHSDQIPLIERLIDSNRALGAWPAVAQNYKLLQFVNERGNANDKPLRIATAQQITRWHLEAVELPTGQAPFSHLSTAKDLVDESLESMDPTGHDSALEYIELLNLQAAISFRTAHHMSTWAGDPIHGITQESIVTSATVDTSDLLFRQNLTIANYTAGRVALERALEIATIQNDMAAQARAEQYIGDWHQLFGRRDSAAKHYTKAQRLAQEANIDLFEKPRRLPNFINDSDPVSSPVASGGHVNYVRTRFDIDRQGRARNVTILEINPEGKMRLAQQARKRLLETRFRPRYENGKAVESKGVEIRFVFPQASNPQRAEGATS